MNKKVCILYTGGTIGMVPTEDGYAPKKYAHLGSGGVRSIAGLFRYFSR